MLIMELGEGGSLRALLATSNLATLTWRARAALAHGVASGVLYLHSQEPPVLHLDLKPANVVLDAARTTPKICDFGCARAPAAVTANGAAGGSPSAGPRPRLQSRCAWRRPARPRRHWRHA